MPAALAGVQQTLQTLDLGDTDDLDIDNEGFAILLHMRSLQVLELWGIPGNVASGQQLGTWRDPTDHFTSRFFSARRKLYSGAPLPKLCI